MQLRQRLMQRSDKSSRQYAIVRRFFLLSIPLTLATLAVYTLADVMLHKLDQREAETKVESVIDIGVSLVQHSLDTVSGHLNFLVDSQATKDFISQDTKHSREHLIDDFLNLINTSRLYDQVRLLSPEGQELIRVELKNGQPISIPQSQLQNKSNRYYYLASTEILDEKMYVSPLDLNVEQGEIELPYKPMLRFSRPLRNEDGELKGVIVLNYLGDLLLNELKREMNRIPGEGSLVNKDGYWLASSQGGNEWGFMLDHKKSFKNSYPNEWQRILQQSRGEFISNGGKFAFATVQPVKKEGVKVSNIDHVLDAWKFVIVSVVWDYNQAFFMSKLQYLYPVLAIYPIGLVMIFFWARASIGKSYAEEKLLKLNKLLELKVKNRTKELEVTKSVTILSMAALAETRDDETGQHLRRTQRYVKILATELQKHPLYRDSLSNEVVRLMYRSAPLHDIGKVGLPDEILLKPGKLTTQEFEIMKTHTLLGVRAIDSSIKVLKQELSKDNGPNFLQFAQDIIHYHHEKWDGSGYPEGLSGLDIPLAARIMAVADVFDALSCRRVYKKAYDKAVTEQIIFSGSGNHFEPAIIEAFRNVREQFWQIHNEFTDVHHSAGKVADNEPERLNMVARAQQGVTSSTST